MVRTLVKAAMCGMAALLTVSTTAVSADDDAVYFCTGYPNADTGTNSVLVLKLEPSEITSQGRKFLRCVLPDIDPSTLKDLVTSGQRDVISRSGVTYNTQIEVAGELLPVRVTNGLSTRDLSGSIESRFKLTARVCGLEAIDSNGLINPSIENADCIDSGNLYYGRRSDKSIFSILCSSEQKTCMLSFEHRGWIMHVHVDRNVAFTSWNAVIEASEKEITSRTILSLNSKGCFGAVCDK
ncbi:hypothetical protein [Roseibium sp.]|uniref:hypothetical protein n=1 Tax=Roseibium sp. TaxID=1936156 RepID=UPI003D0F1669